jgi:gluconokinase
MKDYVIGIDVGTGSLKGLAVDSIGTVLSSSHRSYPLIQNRADQLELDPELIWQAFMGSIRELVDHLQSNPKCIVLSTAMHSLIAIGENDVPLTKMITWADNRAGAIGERIKKSAAGEMLYEQTGTPIHAMSPLCKLVWLREHDSPTFQRTVRFISIKEYLWWRIFRRYEVDYSIASASGLMDITRLQWNENALSTAEIKPENLSALVDTNVMRSDPDPLIMKQMGLNRDTSFVIGASDGCMANLGSFATAPGIAALTIGTSGAVRVASKTPVYNFEAMTFNYRLDAQTYICGGPTNNGGVVLKWFAEEFLQKKLSSANDYHELLSKIKTVPAGSQGLMFLPYLLGERAPIWDAHATALFFGMRLHHTQPHFTRAVIEGISMALYNIAENMERCGMNITQVNVSGGFVHSTEWLEILANVFQKKICLINTSDASALGAAYLGLKSLGIIRDYTDLTSKDIKEVFPDPQIIKTYQKQYQVYQNLYKRLNEEMIS